jgi:hypothetical protein
VCAVLLLCTPGVAGADGEISTDRPDVSDNTKTVRPGRGALGVRGLVTKDVALDVAVGTSLVGPGPDYAVKAGVSVRFGR